MALTERRMMVSHSNYEWLDPDDISVEPWFNKSPCDDEAFQSLKDSINKFGYCSDRPITVAEYDGKLVLIAGYRRMKATPSSVGVYAIVREVKDAKEALKLYEDSLPI